MKKPLIYLAGPYSHQNKEVRDNRESDHAICAVNLLKNNEIVYSPIAETATLASLGGLKNTDWDFWRVKDINQLMRCDKIYVLMIPGWKESKGTRGEVKFALNNNIPIEFINKEGTKHIITSVLDMFEVQSVEDLND